MKYIFIHSNNNIICGLPKLAQEVAQSISEVKVLYRSVTSNLWPVIDSKICHWQLVPMF